MGIYQIKSKHKNKCYIGCSQDVEKRFSEHKSKLKTNKHANKHLQNHWNKHGQSDFEFSIIETVADEHHLLEREQFHIDEASKIFEMFNCSNTADPCRSLIFNRSKTYIVTDPSGHEEVVTNLERYCIQNGWGKSALHKVASGSQNHFRGYLCRHQNQTLEQWHETKKRSDKSGAGWKGKWVVTHPDGIEEIVLSLHAFCKSVGITYGPFQAVASGRRKTHHGYKARRLSFASS